MYRLFSAIAVFNLAQIIFIDEVDSMCRQRSSSEDDHSRRIKTEFLKQVCPRKHNLEIECQLIVFNQMDGIKKDAQGSTGTVFVLCATNCPWDLDSAFLRRFQKRIYIPLPDASTRRNILMLKVKHC